MTASTYLILCHLAPTKCRMSVRFSDIETTGCPGDAGWHIVVERPGHKSNPLATPCVIDFLQKTRGTQPGTKAQCHSQAAYAAKLFATHAQVKWKATEIEIDRLFLRLRQILVPAQSHL